MAAAVTEPETALIVRGVMVAVVVKKVAVVGIVVVVEAVVNTASRRARQGQGGECVLGRTGQSGFCPPPPPLSSPTLPPPRRLTPSSPSLAPKTGPSPPPTLPSPSNTRRQASFLFSCTDLEQVKHCSVVDRLAREHFILSDMWFCCSSRMFRESN